tara:strand:- start:28368 stop:28643 length:276 start_codon:yes stop_codon:yes gene_type:complete
MGRRRKKRMDSQGYYSNSEETTEAEAHGFKREVRVSAKTSRVEAKTAGKAAVIESKALLAQAKANKRKWLVALIAIGMAAYMFIKAKIGVG